MLELLQQNPMLAGLAIVASVIALLPWPEILAWRSGRQARLTDSVVESANQFTNAGDKFVRVARNELDNFQFVHAGHHHGGLNPPMKW